MSQYTVVPVFCFAYCALGTDLPAPPALPALPRSLHLDTSYIDPLPVPPPPPADWTRGRKKAPAPPPLPMWRVMAEARGGRGPLSASVYHARQLPLDFDYDSYLAVVRERRKLVPTPLVAALERAREVEGGGGGGM